MTSKSLTMKDTIEGALRSHYGVRMIDKRDGKDLSLAVYLLVIETTWTDDPNVTIFPLHKL